MCDNLMNVKALVWRDILNILMLNGIDEMI